MQKGIITLEMLIAMSLLVVAICAVLPLVSGSQSTLVSLQTNQEAIYQAQSLLENARATARQDLSLLQNCDDAGLVKCPGTPGPFYSRKLTVVNLDNFSKTATAQVSWENNVVEFSTVLANWQQAVGGDTCSQTVTGDWTHPQLLGSADIGPNNEGTNIDVVAKKAYVAAHPTVRGTPNFFMVDISDPTLSQLPILGSVSTNTTTAGLAAVKVAGSYAYVANASTTSQLQVIDISVPTAPIVVASLRVTQAGDSAVGNSIFYADQKIYLGLMKSSGAEFYVIDVSNPKIPVVKASFETDTQINGITVKNGVAYLAVPDDASTSTPEQLRLLDVSQANAGIIFQTATFSYPNIATMSGESVFLSANANTLYLGRGGLNAAKNPNFFQLNVTDKNNITQINSKYISTSPSLTVKSIIARNNLAFLSTSDPLLNFQIWDVNNLSGTTPYASINTGQPAAGQMDCNENLMYVAQKSNKALQIIGPGN